MSLDPLPVSTSSPAVPPTGSILQKVFLWSAWLIYIAYLLLSDLPPGNSLLHTQPATLQLALQLSLNFWFVLPALLPQASPVLHPALEGLFNLTIAWGLLFWGFATDGRQQRVSIVPFLLGTAFLTNLFYLPWLALRQPNRNPPLPPLSPFEKLAESRWLPGMLAIVALVAFAWAGWARPEFGSLTDRWQALLQLSSSDRLAYSFWVDLAVFWLFQGWLVNDDLARRQWQSPFALWVARLVPFLGLVAYMLLRPRLAASSQPSSSQR